MAERLPTSNERKGEALEQAASERSAELLRKHEQGERYDEGEAKHSAEQARTEANQEALFSKEYSTEQKNNTMDSDGDEVITPRKKQVAYKQTMNHIRRSMNPTERTFSKVIHNKAVEKVSDIAGSTVARPNAILFGGIFAFIGVLVLYLYARHVGFALTGFQTIGTFIVGWIFGMLVDLVRVTFKNKR
jgi:preprotein translocase subunit SecF